MGLDVVAMKVVSILRRTVMNLLCIFFFYVDDMLITGSDMRETNKLKKQLSSEFEMKDLVQLSKYSR